MAKRRPRRLPADAFDPPPKKPKARPGCVTEVRADGTTLVHAIEDMPRWNRLTDDLAALQRQNARLFGLLLDVAQCGVEFADPRVDYVTLQVPVELLKEIRTATGLRQRSADGGE